jgi:hypothetical protein
MDRFSDVSAVEAHGLDGAGSAVFTGAVSPHWTIGGKPNGGYLLATIGRAAVATSAHDHLLAISAHFLASPDPGPVEIVVETLRSGRSASQARARLSQGGRACVEAIVTIGTLEADTKPFWGGGVPDGDAAPREACVRVEGNAPNGLVLPIMDQVDLRLDPACAGFAVGEPDGTGEMRGWLALGQDEVFDPISLVYAVDAFPPASFNVAMSGWVPTLELTVYLRALPAPGPVRVLHKVGLIDGGRMDEVCYVWDSTGRVVAHSTQLAGIRVIT